MEDTKRRDRVAKACALCRRKKIKCNGSMPCSHCLHLKTECEYHLNKQRKPRAKVAANVQSRINRLEDLIVRIAEKVDSLDRVDKTSVLERGNGLDSRASLQEERDDSLDLETSTEMCRTPTQLPERESYFLHCKAIMTEAFKNEVPNHTRRLLPLYKGLHLGFLMIFGTLSIGYIRQKLQPQDHYITMPLELLLFYVTAWKRVFSSVWAEPHVQTAAQIAELKEGQFPSNRAIVDDMIRMYREVHMVEFLCPTEAVRELFDTYYANKKLPTKERRRLTYLELMVMTIVLAFSTAVLIDGRNPRSTLLMSEAEFPAIQKVSNEQLLALQEQMFMNTVFYYNRILAVSEGIVSVQALLLLLVYLETLWVISEVNYILVSLAVRYAQEMGLHRIETSLNCLDDEKTARLKVWAACQHMDIEVCYRLGKPPLVNIADVSVLDPFREVTTGQLRLIMGEHNHCSNLDESLHHYLFKLSQMRSLTYVRLFSASVGFESVKRVQEIVSEINSQLFELARDMEGTARPRFYNEAGFDTVLALLGSPELDYHACNALCTMLLTYFSHMMIVNRVPWQVVVDEGDTPPLENLEYRKLSLDSARTILHLVRSLSSVRSLFLTLNWIVHFPFLAVVNLLSNCLNHLDDSEVFKDLSLIIDVSMNFFGVFQKRADFEPTRLLYMRLQMMDMLVRILLRISIKIIEESNGMQILQSNPALRDHLEFVERKYPQFYQKVESSTDMSGLLQSICTVWRPSKWGNVDERHPMSDLLSSMSQSASYSSYNSTPLRVDPSIPNIMHPTDLDDIGAQDKGIADWLMFGDDIAAFTNEEMMNMPNVFFDNGL